MMFSHFRQGRRPVTGKDRDARFPSRMGMGLLLAALLLLPGCAQAVPDSGAPLRVSTPRALSGPRELLRGRLFRSRHAPGSHPRA